MTLTFDIQTVKLIVWCRCPVDDVCQLASKSVRQTNDERTDGRTDTLRTYCLCLPGCPGGGIITDPGSYRQCIYDTACSMPDFKQLLTQSWTWVHFAKSNPTQSTSWLTQPNPIQSNPIHDDHVYSDPHPIQSIVPAVAKTLSVAIQKNVFVIDLIMCS